MLMQVELLIGRMIDARLRLQEARGRGRAGFCEFLPERLKLDLSIAFSCQAEKIIFELSLRNLL